MSEHELFLNAKMVCLPFIFCFLSTVLLSALCIEKLNVQGHFEKF